MRERNSRAVQMNSEIGLYENINGSEHYSSVKKKNWKPNRVMEMHDGH